MPKTTEKPAIYSADDQPLEIGQKIYHVERCCDPDKPYKVKIATIHDLDLNRRKITVLKDKGREVIISVSQIDGLCESQGKNQSLIYARQAGAIKEAKELSQHILKRLQKEHKEAIKQYEREDAQHKEYLKVGVEWAREEVKEAQEQLEEFKKALKNLKVSK